MDIDRILIECSSEHQIKMLTTIMANNKQNCAHGMPFYESVQCGWDPCMQKYENGSNKVAKLLILSILASPV